MRIIWHREELEHVPRLIVLGNFDGVHIAHQKLFREAAASAHAHHLRSSALVFEPHPRQFFQPESPIKLLTLPYERQLLIEACGIEELIVLPFDDAFAHLSPEHFVRDILQPAWVKRVHVGQNYHFGHRGLGDTHTLRILGDENDFSVQVMPMLHMQGEVVSSTSVRQLLGQGKVQDAALMLGYSYTLSGCVVHGEQVGRTMGYPTANIDVSHEKLLPRYGVYSGTINMDLCCYHALVNIGMRPTVQGSSPTVEAYIRGFDGDVYGKTLAVALHQFIRPEQRFAGLDELKNQIALDLEKMCDS